MCTYPPTSPVPSLTHPHRRPEPLSYATAVVTPGSTCAFEHVGAARAPAAPLHADTLHIGRAYRDSQRLHKVSLQISRGLVKREERRERYTLTCKRGSSAGAGRGGVGSVSRLCCTALIFSPPPPPPPLPLFPPSLHSLKKADVFVSTPISVADRRLERLRYMESLLAALLSACV